MRDAALAHARKKTRCSILGSCGRVVRAMMGQKPQLIRSDVDGEISSSRKEQKRRSTALG